MLEQPPLQQVTESSRLLSASNQQKMQAIHNVSPLFADPARAHAAFYPLILGPDGTAAPPAPLLADGGGGPVAAPAPARSIVPSYQPGIDMCTRLIREADENYGSTCKPLSSTDYTNLVLFTWVNMSITNLWSTNSTLPPTTLLERAFRRLIAFVVEFFGAPLAVLLRILCDSAVDLHHKYPKKLPMSFICRTIDLSLERLRAEAREGPRSSGLDFMTWARRHVCSLSSQTDMIRHQLDSYVPAPEDARIGDRGKRQRDSPAVAAGSRGVDTPTDGVAPPPSPGLVKLPAPPAGAPAVCHNWIRQKGPCRGQDDCKSGTKRAHAFDGWDKSASDDYRAAVLAQARR
jgi:hypothetical protein